MADPASLLVFHRVPSRLRRKPVRDFALRLREELAPGRQFTCLITEDAELRRLNRQFRGKDAATDVLSFPHAAIPGIDPPALGELAISATQARRQAAERGHSLEDEICVLMLHGVLHLLGMDHEADKGQMRRAETRWRRRLGLPDGLIERSAR